MKNTAQKELDNKLNQYRLLQTPEEKEEFRKNLFKELDQKSEVEHVVGLLALKEAVHKSRLAIEPIPAHTSRAYFQIFPDNNDESIFLQTLFDRLNIAYRFEKQ
jgi:hypothetical protein